MKETASMARSYVANFDTHRFLYFIFLLAMVFWTAIMTYTNHLNVHIFHMWNIEGPNNAASTENSEAWGSSPLTGIHSSTNDMPSLASFWPSLLLPSHASYFTFFLTNIPIQTAYAQDREENKTTNESAATEPNAQIATPNATRNPVTNPDSTSSGGQTANNSSEQVAVENRELPDDDCLFNPSMEKCSPVGNRCPPGFLMNEDQNCFPDKPCPSGFTKIDEDETGTCHPVEPEKEDKEIITTASKSAEQKKEEQKVVDKGEFKSPLEVIRQVIRENQSNQVLHAESESCPPISDSLPLTGEMKPNGIKIMVFSYPCKFDNGNVTLEIPSNLTLVAGHFDEKVLEATIIPMEKIPPIASNDSSSSLPSVSSSVYRAQVNGQMTSPDQLSDNGRNVVSDVNTLILWNNNMNQSIVFGPDNNILPSIFLRR
jgi:hypothetical protein